MRVDAFRDLLADALAARGVTVGRYAVDDDLSDLAVQDDDGEIRLRIVRTSPPGGEREDSPAVRAHGQAIEIVRREPQQ